MKRKTLKYITFALLAVIIVIAFPLGIDWLIIANNFTSHIPNSEWVGFLSGYIGSIVSMAGIIITIIYTTSPSFSIIEQILSISGVNESKINFLTSSNFSSSTPPLKEA